MPEINSTISSMSIPQTRYFSNKASDYDDAVNLTLGVPDFDTDPLIKQALVDAFADKKSLKYSHNAGLIELRQAISDYYFNKYHAHFDPEDQIIVTAGGSEAIDSSLRTILEKGDQVIIPQPAYPAYQAIVTMLGGEVIPIDTSETNFVLSPQQVEEKITPKTKAIILNYPTNPTGVSVNQDQAQALVKVIKDHDIFLLSDEIYGENSLTQDHISFSQFPEIKDQAIIINGLSKSHAMTGWRLGYLLSSKKLTPSILIPHLNNTICASLPSQYAGLAALKHGLHIPQKMNQAYRERLAYLVQRLDKMGLDYSKPQGSFYIFPSIKSYDPNAFNFCLNLLEDQHLAVVPGSAFGQAGEGYIRISFATSLDQLEEGMDRLETFLSTYSTGD